MVEGHVPQGVWVQLPPSALNRRKAVCFFLLRMAFGVIWDMDAR